MNYFVEYVTPEYLKAAVGLTVAALGFWFFRQLRSTRLLPLRNVLGPSSKHTSGLRWSRLDGHYGGRSVILRFDEPFLMGYDRSLGLHLFVTVASSISYSVWCKTAGRSITSKLRLSRHIETGIPDFDASFVLLSSEPERVTRLLIASKAARDAINVLLQDRDINSLVQDKGLLHATAALNAEVTIGYVRVVLHAMKAVAEAGESI